MRWTISVIESSRSLDDVVYQADFVLGQATDSNATSKTLIFGNTKGNTTALNTNSETVEVVFADRYGRPVNTEDVDMKDIKIVEIFKGNMEVGERFYAGTQSKKIIESLEASYESAPLKEEYKKVGDFVDISGTGTLILYGKPLPKEGRVSLDDHAVALYAFGTHM